MLKTVTNYNNRILIDDFSIALKSRDYWDKFKNKKILITGCYGTLGRYLSYFFIYLNEEHNYNIDIYANGRNKEKMMLFFEKEINKHYFHPIYILENMDKEVLNEIDFIFHAGAPAQPDFYTKMPVETMLPNVVTLNYLLQNMNNNSKLLFFSTGAVYGSGVEFGVESNEDNVGIIDFNKLTSTYSVSKRCGELLCKAYYEEYGKKVYIVRIYHTYGPTIDVNYDKRAFSSFVKNCLMKENIKLNSDGTAKRAFLYLLDGMLGMFDIIFLGDEAQAYNLVSNYNFIEIRELAKYLSETNDIDLRFEIENHNDKYKNTDISVLPSNKKLKSLGWDECLNYKEGFNRTIDSLKIEN